MKQKQTTCLNYAENLVEFLGIGNSCKTPCHPEANARIENTKKPWMKASLSKWMTISLSENVSPSSIDGSSLFFLYIDKESFSYSVLGIPLRVPLDCLCERRHSKFFQTPRDFNPKHRICLEIY